VECENGALDINEAPSAGRNGQRIYKNGKKRKERIAGPEQKAGFRDERATPMSGKLAYHRPCQVIHFELDSFALKAAAKAKNATVTEYMLALMFIAGKYATDETKGKVQIQVPVNMRKYYPSDTLRNLRCTAIKDTIADIEILTRSCLR
jgi:NRPS condensation-like uncharacterized protein